MKWACVLALAGMSVACNAGQAAYAPAVSEDAAPAAEALEPVPSPEPAVTAAASKPSSKPRPASAPKTAAAPKAVEPAQPVAAPAAVKTSPAVPAFREVTLPEGTELVLDLETAVASDASQVEDAVRATLREPVRIGNDTVLPAGTELTGIVTEVERAGRVKGRARVAYTFSSLRMAGHSYDVVTSPVLHEAEATKGQDAAKIGVGAGAGALIGGILGGGGGAAKGAAIGGAAGTGAVLATRGKEVRLEPGTPVTTSLTAPLTVRIRG